MNTSLDYRIGMILGIVTALLLAAIIGLVFRKRRIGKNEYDERQKAAQGKAYKWAFFTLLGYLALWGLFDLYTGVKWCDVYTGAFIGVCISVLVFALICIREDAYVSYKEKGKSVYLILGVIGLANLLIPLPNLGKAGYFVEDGMLTVHTVNLLIGAMMLIILAAMAVKELSDKRKAE